MAMMKLLALAFSLIHISTFAAVAPPYTPTEQIHLSCGASSDAASVDGRVWKADTLSSYLPSNSKTISEPSTASKQDPQITEQVLYLTARIIHSNLTYSFSKLSPGPKFIRLYFYSSTYNNNNNLKNTNTSFFSVTANNYTLLTNFSAFLNIQALNPPSPTLVKEYIINVNDDDRNLNLTFFPSDNSFAFVNAIEIVSMPTSLYYRGDTVGLKLVRNTNSQLFYNLKNDKALETMYRLNVGGAYVSAINDTGMFREWFQDQDYLIGNSNGYFQTLDVPVEYTPTVPNYTAPKIVYNSARYMVEAYSNLYNMTWLFPVDSGFFYLLRLHFCEIFSDITEVDARIFKIYINNMTAEEQADVIQWGDRRPKVAVFRDYVVFVGSNGDGKETKQYLWLSMSPDMNSGSKRPDALLNGLEIFKLSNPSSLAAPNPPQVITNKPSSKSSISQSKSKVWLIAVIGAVIGVGGALVAAFLIFRCCRARWTKEKSRSKKGSNTSVGSSLPAVLCRHFELDEIKRATANFDEKLVIGVGGFGNVYAGYIEDKINGSTKAAIKRLDKSSEQGLHEFLTEIEMLSKLRHVHLVSLIGYCDDDGEMILVYDYMSRGTLRDHLKKTNTHHLSWKRRLQICIGAAKGLDYLHTGANHSIIHRDVKSTNILLDDKWVAKVSDFGLSKVGPMGGANTHVSTDVKGSFGYLDPEYFKRQQLSEKSDVYSFGVVLFEVLCCRPAIMHNASKDEVSLAGWVRFCKGKGTIDEIIDPKVKGEISAECLKKYIELGLRCLKVSGIERPSMGDVVWNLEFALQLQEAADEQSAIIIGEDDQFKEGIIKPMTTIIPLLPQGIQASTEEDDGDIFSRSMEGSSSSYSSTKSKNSNGFSIKY